jgi:CRISPR type III-B/RAMP module-associated protein Cmr5
MQNLDQLRAARALADAARTDKSSVARLPGMILTNGLLSTLAFACEEGKENRKAQLAAADSLARHLAALLPELAGVNTGSALGARLATGPDLTLQRATTEALAYFSYLKRFAGTKD